MRRVRRRDVRDLGLAAAGRRRVERAGAEEREPRRARPADVGVDGVLQRRALADELAVLELDVDEIPVEPGVEARREPGGDVGREDGVGEEDGVVAAVLDDLREHVDARLRQRLLDLAVLADPDLRGAELPGLGRERLRALAGDHGRDVAVAERRRLREHAERALLQLVAVVLEEDERRHQTSLFSARKSTIACAALPSSSILRASPRAGGSPSASTVGPRAGLARLAGVDAEVGEREDVLRLLLRAHDPLERRVARLVDRVAHRDDRGQRRLERVVAELRLPLDADGAAVDRELHRLRDDRPAEPLGDRRPEDGAVGVGGLLAEQDEVGVLLLERRREQPARRDEVGARGRVVGDEHGAVGAHRERLAQRVERLLRPERDGDDLGVGVALEAQRLLDRVRVEVVERALAGAVEALRAGIEAARPLGHVLDADGDLHPGGTLVVPPAPLIHMRCCEREHVLHEGLAHLVQAVLPDRALALVPAGEREPLVAVEVVQQMCEIGDAGADVAVRVVAQVMPDQDVSRRSRTSSAGAA